VSQQLEINIRAVDNASKTVADASSKVANSMREVEHANQRVTEANRQVSESAKDIAHSLSDSERKQLDSVSASQQLEAANQRVSIAKNELNIAVREHGAASEEAARALREFNQAQSDAASLSSQLGSQIQDTTRSTKDLVVGFSGVATSAFSLYNAYDRVGNAQLRLDRANVTVKSNLASVENAQKRLNDAVRKFGADSEQAQTAARDLGIAQDRYQVAVDNAENAQKNMNNTMIQGALQVVPTAITMVDGLSRAWKNFPDMTGTLTSLSKNVSNVGVSAKTAALGVAAFMGGFLIADQLLSAIPEDLRAIAGALTATIAAVVAATVAWMAFHGTMTVGVAVPIILAAVGVGIAGVKAAVAMAEGGLVTKPTLAVLGEAGPELVVPYDKVKSDSWGTQYVTVNPVINVGNVSSALDLAQVTRSVNKGIAEALRRRL
jgi:hypothetical protein